MATGSEHYREAEALLTVPKMMANTDENRTLAVAMAQVHATLALAAAQVEDMESDDLRTGWAEIVGGA